MTQKIFEPGQESMSSQIEKQEPFDHAFFQQNLPQYYRALLLGFRKVARSLISFTLLYALLFTTEVCCFFFFFSFFSKSAFFALAFGGLFLTCFSYFVLLFYYQARKPEQLLQLRKTFLDSCRQIITVPEGEAVHHLSMADALSKLAAYLQDFELNFYKAPKTFSKILSLFAARSFREDIFQMKLLLLEQAVDEHLKQVRITPTDLEVHASLASTYVALSKVYKGAGVEEKYRLISRLAIEEFSILSHYAPNDPWVHEQLALGYRDLGMPEAEMREVETLYTLRSQDKEILYRLGSLYFKQGMNAKGLQIYEELKKGNYKKAGDLIASYGNFS